MSVTTNQNKNQAKHPAVHGRDHRALVVLPLSTIIDPIRRALARAARLLIAAADAVAEAREQRAIIEAELYRRRYKHSSKNDDDLPIVR